MDTDSALPRDDAPDMAEVLTALLSSRVRYKLLALFIAGPDVPRHARQIAKDAGEHFNSVWQELKHLESLGLLASEKVGSQVRYRTDSSFALLPELRQLLRHAGGPAAMEQATEQAIVDAPAPGALVPPQPAGAHGRPVTLPRPRPPAATVAPFVIGETD